jgi:hypothetical protein
VARKSNDEAKVIAATAASTPPLKAAPSGRLFFGARPAGTFSLRLCPGRPNGYTTRRGVTVADIRDPIAAMNNAKAKEEAEEAGRDANYTQTLDDQQAVVGPNSDNHRAGPGEGVRAPLAQESGGKAQYSSFDGKGNERVVVLGENEKGQPAQGVGPDAASAQADAEGNDTQIGDMGSDPIAGATRTGPPKEA